jgi:hypothetical protein
LLALENSFNNTPAIYYSKSEIEKYTQGNCRCTDRR